jgi:hypothetical protein
MTNLVDSPLLFTCKVSLLVNGLLFKEVADFIARREEVVVTSVILFVRGEFGLWE